MRDDHDSRSNIVRGLISATIHALALERRLNPSHVLFCPYEAPAGNRAQWLECMRIRRHAIYLAVMTFNITQTEMARALGVSRSSIQRLLIKVEDERDHFRLDRKLDRLCELYQRGSDAILHQF